MAALLDKGLHQQRPVAVVALEVGGQAAQGQREGLGGEVAAGHAGTDQEAAEPGHAMQLAHAPVGVPADEGVARGQCQGRRGEAEGPQHAVLGDQQVAHLRADVLDGPARVLAAHQFVPDAPLVVVGHRDQLQSAHPVDPPGHVDGRGNRAAEPARPAAPVVVAGSGQ